MQQCTIEVRRRLNSATLPEKAQIYQELGFTPAEADMMVQGSTDAEAVGRLGGVWTVGNISYAQAISADHARKIYEFTFGGTAPEPHLRAAPAWQPAVRSYSA